MKQYKYTINGTKYEVTVGDVQDNVVAVSVNGQDYRVELEPEPQPVKKKPVLGTPAPQAAKPAAPRVTDQMRDALKSPLPGVITDIKVAVGDEVQEGDTLVVLEAMKMANNLQAEKGGKVTAVCVETGQSVMEGDVLVMIE